MSDLGAPTPASWRAGMIEDFARSELFDHTFQEGMDLVGETATYLDGPGRRDAKLLSRNAALAYAAESMRLTTRLMQVASWLLVQRAVREGNMAAEAASQEGYRLGDDLSEVRTQPSTDALPSALAALLDRSTRLYERIRHLDRRMYLETGGPMAPAHPVLQQIERLKGAFEP